MAPYGAVDYGGGGATPGLLMYRPNIRRQHGHGIGSFFGSIFRRLIPLAKTYVLPHAVKAARNVASDMLEGKNFKSSIKENATGALKGVASQVFNQSGSGMARGRKRKSKSKGFNFVKRRKTTKAKRVKAKKYTSNKKRKLKKSDFVTLFD